MKSLIENEHYNNVVETHYALLAECEDYERHLAETRAEDDTDLNSLRMTITMAKMMDLVKIVVSFVPPIIVLYCFI